MTRSVKDILDLNNPKDLRNVVLELKKRVDVLSRSTLKVGSIDEISNDLGVQDAGYVGGWQITPEALTQLLSNTGIILDAENQIIKVGDTSGVYLQIDGANERIRSSNFVTGQAGFNIDAGTGDAEFNNIVARGELRTFLLTAENQMAVAGTIIICKDSGKVAAAVGSSDTTIDFGQAMTPSDWVKFQGPDTGGSASLEWVLVGSLVSGTTYNVTRDVDGSGANNWADDTPFAVIGAEGDCRIEQVAGSSATIRLITQGSTWNDSTIEVEMTTVDGAISAGAGSVLLNSQGIILEDGTVLNGQAAIQYIAWLLSQQDTDNGKTRRWRMGLQEGSDEPEFQFEYRDPSGSNLITDNPGFEDGDTSGWTYSATYATLSIFGGQRTGDYCGYFAPTVQQNDYVELTSGNRAAVTAGNDYTFTVWVRQKYGGKTMKAEALWYNSTPTLIQTDTIYSGVVGTAYTELSQALTAPTGAVAVAIRLTMTDSSLSNQIWWIDDAEISLVGADPQTMVVNDDGFTFGGNVGISGGFWNVGEATELTIASGAVTATQTRHAIDTQGDASTDDLDTINGGKDGDILIINTADISRTVVVKDGIGNLLLAGNFTMDSTADSMILRKGSGSNWIEIARSNNL